MNQESVSFQSLGLEKVGLCCSGVREGLWKLVAFELVSEKFNRHSEDIGICEKLFWKQQIRFSLGWIGGERDMGWGASSVWPASVQSLPGP